MILDEIHAIWPSKRGDLLALGLARLATVRAATAGAIGLSATVDDPDLIRAWLSAGGGKDGVDLVRGAGRRAAGGRRAAVGGPGALGRPHRPPRHGRGL